MVPPKHRLWELVVKSMGGAMKKTLRALGIDSKHYAHIGRVIGPKFLEFHEATQDEIRVMGNWNPNTQESTYSSKLPMKAIQTMGGFDQATGSGMHYNPKQVWKGHQSLKK